VDAALIAGFTALNGLAAQISIPLPFTPIPLTLQTFAVLVTAASLGTTRGLLSLGLYVALGVAGVPWFSHGSSGMGGPSFGYVLGFLLAGLVVGRIADRGVTRSVRRTVATFVIGSLAIYAVGVPWLMASTGMHLPAALAAGVVPFLIGDAIKALAAGAALPATWRLVQSARK
jgi:biotin transport system substrate-specific component